MWKTLIWNDMALVSELLYQYLLDWLCPAMEAEYKALYGKGSEGGKLKGWKGKWDKQVMQHRIDRLEQMIFNFYQRVCQDVRLEILVENPYDACETMFSCILDKFNELKRK